MFLTACKIITNPSFTSIRSTFPHLCFLKNNFFHVISSIHSVSLLKFLRKTRLIALLAKVDVTYLYFNLL